MALTEKQYINKIEFLHTGDVQVRESTEVYRDEQMIAQEYHRRVVSADEQLDGPLAERLQGIQLEVVAERNILREEKAQLETQKADLEKQVSDKDAELQSRDDQLKAKDEQLQSKDAELQKANEDHQQQLQAKDAELQKANEDHQKTIENYGLLEEAKKLVEDELALAKQELESLRPVDVVEPVDVVDVEDKEVVEFDPQPIV